MPEPGLLSPLMSKLATFRGRDDLPATNVALTEAVSNRLIRIGTTIAKAIAVAVLILFGVVTLVSMAATLTLSSYWS